MKCWHVFRGVGVLKNSDCEIGKLWLRTGKMAGRVLINVITEN